MASIKQGNNKPKKRKQSNDSSKQNSLASKKPKLASSGHEEKKKKPFESFKKSNESKEIKVPKTKKERRLHAKELAEARKKKRKRHYTLEQELANLWEKMRQRNIAKEDRSGLISKALNKMKGKIPEIASSHVSSRVLQTCVKYSTQPERDAVFLELKPHFLMLACNTYAVHLVNKMLDNGIFPFVTSNRLLRRLHERVAPMYTSSLKLLFLLASKKQLAEFITTLRGHVTSLLRHMVGSVVVEHAYQLGNATQKQELLLELYSTELQLFKDLATIKESRLLDVISKLDLKKSSVVRHMTSIIQPILEKGIIDHSIIHKVLIEYLTLADKMSAADVIQQLSGPLLVRMIHTRDGARLGIFCIKHGSAKERKKIVKGMKEHIAKIAHDQYGSLVLSSLISTVDDTKLVLKIVVRGLQTILKELLFDKNGRRPLLQLLHPNCLRYFSPDDLIALDSVIPTLSSKGSELKSSEDAESCSEEENSVKEDTMAEADDSTSPQNAEVTEGGKKDTTVRRQELLVDSGLADNLIDVCTENAGDLLRSNFGKEVLYEVAIGGSGGILHPKSDDKLNALHEAIACLAVQPKSEELEEEHVLENFHSSRTIRKLILDSPTFATTLWTKALQGNCESWVQGHSSKVISAYLETSDVNVRELAKKELQPYEDTFKIPQNKQPPNET